METVQKLYRDDYHMLVCYGNYGTWSVVLIDTDIAAQLHLVLYHCLDHIPHALISIVHALATVLLVHDSARLYSYGLCGCDYLLLCVCVFGCGYLLFS